MKKKLPSHLAKLIDTPEKKQKFQASLDKARIEEDFDMRLKGYTRKGNQWVK